MSTRKHKNMYIPLKTVSLSDGTINRWYVLSWYKHDFIFGVKEEQPKTKRNFLFDTSLA